MTGSFSGETLVMLSTGAFEKPRCTLKVVSESMTLRHMVKAGNESVQGCTLCLRPSSVHPSATPAALRVAGSLKTEIRQKTIQNEADISHFDECGCFGSSAGFSLQLCSVKTSTLRESPVSRV